MRQVQHGGWTVGSYGAQNGEVGLKKGVEGGDILLQETVGKVGKGEAGSPGGGEEGALGSGSAGGNESSVARGDGSAVSSAMYCTTIYCNILQCTALYCVYRNIMSKLGLCRRYEARMRRL